MSGSSVSVALAAYNGSEFIERQLASILDQTVLPEEVVVADDGSNDGTKVIVEGMFRGRNGPRLVFVPAGSSRGVSTNFARAIARCNNGLIALCDQDDVWVRDRIEQQRQDFDRDPRLTLVHSDADLIDADGAPMGTTLFQSLGVGDREIERIRDGHAFDVLLKRNIVTGATVMFRKSLMNIASPFPELWVHDEWLAIIAAAAGSVRVSPARLIAYRQHGANEIGVLQPSLGNRVRRMLEPRGDRNARLASRATILTDRLRLLGDLVPAEVLAAAEGKALYESRRARWPSNRLARAPRVLAELAKPDYARFSSQGRMDALRDIAQPAGPSSSVKGHD